MANNVADASDKSQTKPSCHPTTTNRSIPHRQASLSEVERTFLSALLIDKPQSQSSPNDASATSWKLAEGSSGRRALDDDVLFSVIPNNAKLAEKREEVEFDNHRDDDQHQNGGRMVEKEEEEEFLHHTSRPLLPPPPRPTRSNAVHIDLWKAHGDGVGPALLRKMSRVGNDNDADGSGGMIADPRMEDAIGGESNNRAAPGFQTTRHRRTRSAIPGGGGSAAMMAQSTSCDSRMDADANGGGEPRKPPRHRRVRSVGANGATGASCGMAHGVERRPNDTDDGMVDEGGAVAVSHDVPSDQEVGSIDDESTASSWSSSQGGFDHYDAWEVLRDEYAEDFGFKVAVDDESEILRYPVEDDVCGQRGVFKLLGTGADDESATPHVLSPPLMDSLLNFVPDHLADDNYWLRFSLVRDGASLDILRRYCRAATHTILAIETTGGEVFGAFASSPWRTHSGGYFGTGEAFLWRMRHGRNTPVHCLFDQARLESEIDVCPYTGSNDYIQLCTHGKLAMGGGTAILADGDHSIREEDEPLRGIDNDVIDTQPAAFLEIGQYGFGLALDENLLHGTTSPCATFGNSNLVNGSGDGETFDVMNLEVWGFTSAQTEAEAERSEMSTFFVRESVSSNLSSSNESSSHHSIFSGDDLRSQERFYRRVGQGEENESDRDAWQYANMMNPVAGSPYGKMGSPYGR